MLSIIQSTAHLMFHSDALSDLYNMPIVTRPAMAHLRHCAHPPLPAACLVNAQSCLHRRERQTAVGLYSHSDLSSPRANVHHTIWLIRWTTAIKGKSGLHQSWLLRKCSMVLQYRKYWPPAAWRISIMSMMSTFRLCKLRKPAWRQAYGTLIFRYISAYLSLVSRPGTR